MADFPIHFRASEYDTEHGQRVRAKRGYLLCEFTGFPILCDSFLDTAAPFSIVPHTISRHLGWSPLAKTLTSAATSTAAPLAWQGIPCELGTISLRLVHLTTGFRSGPLVLTAKFPARPAAPPLERSIILGLALFDDNNAQLFLGQQSGMLAGNIVTP
jgi:hypothetical protein